MGRLTKDVEVRYTQNNTPVATFTLAVNRRFSKEKEADFINIMAWGKLAEFCSKYFGKGQQVAVVGRIQTRNYEKDGVKHYITEVIAEECYFAENKKNETTFNDVPMTEINGIDDELPF